MFIKGMDVTKCSNTQTTHKVSVDNMAWSISKLVVSLISGHDLKIGYAQLTFKI